MKSFPKPNSQPHIFNYLNKTKHQIVFQKENLTLTRISQNKEGRLFRETSLSYYIGILNLVLEQDLDFLYGRPERLTSLNLVFDRLTSMQDRRMVFLSYDLSNMGKRGVRIFFRQIHRDLTGLHELTFTGISLENRLIKVEILANDLLNHLYGDLFLLQPNRLANHTFRQRQIDLTIIDNRISH